MDFLFGPMMLRNIMAILRSDMTTGLRLVMNDGRHRKGSATLDWVGMAIMAAAMVRRSCGDVFACTPETAVIDESCHIFEQHIGDEQAN